MLQLYHQVEHNEEVAVQIYGHLWNAPQVEYRVAIMFCDAVRVPGPAPQLVQDVGHSTNRVGLRVVDAALYPAQFLHQRSQLRGASFQPTAVIEIPKKRRSRWRGHRCVVGQCQREDAAGVSVGFGTGVAVDTGVGVAMDFGVGVAVESGVGVAVDTGVCVAVGLGVGVAVDTDVGVPV